MGDPRKTRKKYQSPGHPWQQARLEEERPLVKDYGLHNKNELWKMHSLARTMATQAKSIIARREDPQSQKQAQLLLNRLIRYNLVKEGEPIETALAISSRDILERRLQTQLIRKNLARTMKQSRQLISHKHIKIGDRVVTSPSYLVSAQEENQIDYADNSAFSSENHPERPEVQMQKELKEEKDKVMPAKKAKEGEEEEKEKASATEKVEEPKKEGAQKETEKTTESEEKEEKTPEEKAKENEKAQ